MGYYTDYDLTVVGGTCDDLNEIHEDLHRISEYTFEENFAASDKHHCLYNNLKWYDHEDNMKELSRLYPDKIFSLRGNGEEFPDVWIEYYKNGDMERHKVEIQYPETRL